MHRLWFLVLVVIAVVSTSSLVAAQPPPHAGPPGHAGPAGNHGKPDQRTFVVHLSGDQEAPPVDPEAKGVVIFHLSKDGQTLRWKLVVNHIADVNAAHIHGPAAADATAGILLTLVNTAHPGEQHGLLERGVITNSPDDEIFEQAIDAMRNGLAYVNVHTTRHGSGEIRGQFGQRGQDEADEAEAEEEEEDAEAEGNEGKQPGRGQGHKRGQNKP